MRVGIIGIVALTAVLSAPALARAQEAADPQWSTTLAMALGSAQVTCDACDSERSRAPSGYVRVGRAFAPGLTVSAELDAWSKKEEWTLYDASGTRSTGSSRFTITTLDAVVQWYPQSSRGFFVDAGLGWGRYSARSKSFDIGGSSVYSNALGYQAGAGYDIPLTAELAITPSVKVFGFTGAKASDLDGRFGANVAQLALGLTWR